MNRRREYIKATQINSECIVINLFRSRNQNANADVNSSEVINFAAQLFQLASKRGRVKVVSNEVLDEAV